MRERWEPDARRVAVVEALGRLLVAGDGSLPGMREIAAAAGVTTGTLQHHFSTKEQMLLFALEHHCRRVGERLRDSVWDGSPRQVLTAVVTELLPLDEPRRQENAVGRAFVVRAGADPEFARHYQDQRAVLLELFGAQFERAGHRQPRAAAVVLAQAVDGLRTDCLLLGDGTAAVATVLDQLLPSEENA